jgi:hypothetical protein
MGGGVVGGDVDGGDVTGGAVIGGAVAGGAVADGEVAGGVVTLVLDCDGGGWVDPTVVVGCELAAADGVVPEPVNGTTNQVPPTPWPLASPGWVSPENR